MELDDIGHSKMSIGFRLDPTEDVWMQPEGKMYLSQILNEETRELIGISLQVVTGPEWDEDASKWNSCVRVNVNQARELYEKFGALLGDSQDS